MFSSTGLEFGWETLRKSTKTRSQNSLCFGRKSNLARSEIGYRETTLRVRGEFLLEISPGPKIELQHLYLT
jgi:hypothetical protein